MNKILRYSSKIFFLKRFETSRLPLISCFSTSSTKQKEKSQKKLDKEKAYESVEKLETMADQDELTKEKLNNLIEDRRKDITKVAAETEIPPNAIMVAALITAPVILGGPLIGIFCMQGLFMEYLPAILAGYLKYNIVQMNFMSGIHWGFAISEHNCQIDAINSSSTVRNLFAAATVPMFISFGLVSGLVYTTSMIPSIKFASLGGLALTHLYILGLDWFVVNNKMAPQWFLKLKIWCSLMSIFGLLSLSYVYMNFDEKVKNKKDIYKRFLVANQERLNIKIKNPS